MKKVPLILAFAGADIEIKTAPPMDCVRCYKGAGHGF
jgi:hypothetical protein